jgi:ATP-dependent RNA helicase RhlE
VKLQAFVVASNQKLALLQQLLANETGRCLIFTRTKRGTERLSKQLARDGFSAQVIHGDRSQSQRTAALAGFQQGRFNVLIATDLASRGIHVQDIAQVINYDMPEIPEDFVHRIGRTGRAGAVGIASSFITAQEMQDFKKLERTLNIKMERIAVSDGLAVEEKLKPIHLTASAPLRVMAKSKMVLLPGEVLRRYDNA